MCLPDFVEFKRVKKSEPIVGYRVWIVSIKDTLQLMSEAKEYVWQPSVGRHKVLESNSGIYAYNNNYDYYNNYNNNYDYYDNNNYDNNNYYYYIRGVIHQYGKVAIHQVGQRSEYAKIVTLFTIRESDARGPKEFLDWIRIFNQKVIGLAKMYKCNTIHYQDFVER